MSKIKLKLSTETLSTPLFSLLSPTPISARNSTNFPPLGSSGISSETFVASPDRMEKESEEKIKGQKGRSSRPFDPVPSSPLPTVPTFETPPSSNLEKFKSFLNSLIQSNLTWARNYRSFRAWKPVIRSSIALWIGLVLAILQPNHFLGAGGFLVLTVGVISPPSLPFSSSLEAFFVQITVVSIVYAWTTLGIYCSHASRTLQFNSVEAFFERLGYTGTKLSAAMSNDILHGVYLETRASAVSAVFLSVGCGLLLTLRAYVGPGVFQFAVIFGLIFVIITMTTALLYPFPYYSAASIFYYPFLFQSSIGLLCSAFILPETLHQQFLVRTISLLALNDKLLQEQEILLKSDPSSLEWLQFEVQNTTNNLISSLTLLSSASTSRKDLSTLLSKLRVLVAASKGFYSFYDIISKHVHRDQDHDLSEQDLVIHIGSTTNSRSHSPAHSPSGSNSPRIAHSPAPRITRRRSFDFPRLSIDDLNGRLQDLLGSGDRGRGSSKNRSTPGTPEMKESKKKREYAPIGIQESIGYMNLETFLATESDGLHLKELLSKMSDPLLSTLRKSNSHLSIVITQFSSSSSTFSSLFRRKGVTDQKGSLSKTQEIIKELEESLESYRNERRKTIIAPFAHLFQDPSLNSQEGLPTTHRVLYWAFLWQSSLISYSNALISIIRFVAELEEKRIEEAKSSKFSISFSKFSFSKTMNLFRVAARTVDEDPASIPGLSRGETEHPRSPDYSSPANANLKTKFSSFIYHSLLPLSSRNFKFFLKTIVFFALISLPAYFPSTVYYFQSQKLIWSLIYSGLTTSVFTGETTMGFILRVKGVIAGATAGLLVWSIAAQAGPGNPFAVAVVAFFTFPLLLYFRIHFPKPIVAIISSSTFALCIGYSYQNAHESIPNIGYGWSVAWRRGLNVLIGITAAFAWSYVPPSSTRKTTVRLTFSRMIHEIGNLLCQVISFSNSKNGTTKTPKILIDNVAALRVKTRKTTLAINAVKYEFSLRGSWPVDRYQALQVLLIELIDWIGQLLAVLSRLDSNWTAAFMKRSQFGEPKFIGALLTALQTASTSLDNGIPLPQLFHPLLESYLRPSNLAGQTYGFEAVLEQDHIEGIPLHVDLETISSENYLLFSNAISSSYAITNRVDRLMVLVKSLCGEGFIIYGMKGDYQAIPEGLPSRWNHSRRNSIDNQ